MYGQMTAGSWIYIGTQGILQGTYETFAAVAAKRFGGTLAGTLTAHRRLRRHGRRPAARGHHERRRLPGRRRRRESRLRRRVETRYLDDAGAPRWTTPCAAVPRGEGGAAGAVGRAWSATRPSVLPELLRRGRARSTSSPTRPRPTTRCRTCPTASTLERLRRTTRRPSRRSSPTGRGRRWPATSRRWSASWTPAPRCSTTATRSAARPSSAATSARSPSPASCRPTSGRCSARARARSGGRRCPATRPTSPPPTGPSSTCSRTTSRLHRWIRLAGERVAFQGLPARICWLGYGERDQAGLRFNEMVADGCASRRRSSSAATTSTAARSPRPYRETEAMARRLRRDRRLAAAQRAGQHRVAARRGCRSTTAAGSASAGRSTPARSASPTARRWPRRRSSGCCANDPGMGVIRHVDAGYDAGAEQGSAEAEPVSVRIPDAARPNRRVQRVRRDCGGSLHPDRARPGTRRLPAVRLDRARTPACREWFTEEAARPRARRRRRTATATSGPGGATRTRTATAVRAPAATSTRCRDGGGVRRPARRRLGARSRSTPCATRGLRPGRGRSASRAFAEEEGARFGVACLGSRLLTGALTADQARGADRRATGSRLAEALRGGRGATRGRLGPDPEPAAPASARSSSCTSSRAAALADLDAPVGVATRDLAARPLAVRLRRARPTTPGTTRLADRHDPMLTFAATVLAAHEAAPRGRRRSPPSARSRVEPNGTNAIPSRVTRLAGRPGRRTVRRCDAVVERSSTGPGAVRTDGTAVHRAESCTGRDRVRRRAARAAGRRCSAARRCCRPGAGHDAGSGRGRRPDRDAVRPQPDRRLARPGRARRPTPTALAGVEPRWPPCWRDLAG